MDDKRKSATMSALWLAHYSIEAWQDAGFWTSYFGRAQEILGASLSRLDENDPVRRRVTSLPEAGSYIATFKAREDTRWLFGKFDIKDLEFSIHHARSSERCENALIWYVPWTFVEDAKNLKRAKELFALSNKSLRSFYAYGEDITRVKNKKKASGGIELQTELVGVFWMTYFNAAYVAYFGKDKFSRFQGVEWGEAGGLTISLAENPTLVTDEMCEEATDHLGKQSFVDPKDQRWKPKGRHALTFEQLSAFNGATPQ